MMGRIVAFEDDDDAERYCAEWRRRAAEIEGKMLVCADYRRVPVFSPAAAESLKQLMAELGPRVERSAMLVERAHATHALQVSRLARETAHEARRRFDDLEAMVAWLQELCSSDESDAMCRFLEGEKR